MLLLALPMIPLTIHAFFFILHVSVLQDIAILEQQQLDSERQLQSVKLARQQKLELKAAQEAKLSKLKYENGSMRADLQRANKELSIRHRQLIEARGNSDNSRKEQIRFDAKLNRALGVARVLVPYQKQIQSSMIHLNEIETRLNFTKGQSKNKLNAAKSRRYDAKHRQELLVKSIQSNQQKIRSIADDIVKVRAEIAGELFLVYILSHHSTFLKKHRISLSSWQGTNTILRRLSKWSHRPSFV